jgi:hypothetical protein
MIGGFQLGCNYESSPFRERIWLDGVLKLNFRRLKTPHTSHLTPPSFHLTPQASPFGPFFLQSPPSQTVTAAWNKTQVTTHASHGLSSWCFPRLKIFSFLYHYAVGMFVYILSTSKKESFTFSPIIILIRLKRGLDTVRCRRLKVWFNKNASRFACFFAWVGCRMGVIVMHAWCFQV